jgi:hypothetical protein
MGLFVHHHHTRRTMNKQQQAAGEITRYQMEMRMHQLQAIAELAVTREEAPGYLAQASKIQSAYNFA